MPGLSLLPAQGKIQSFPLPQGTAFSHSAVQTSSNSIKKPRHTVP